MSDFRPGAPAAKGLLEKVADEDTEITSSRDGGSGGAGVPGGAPAPKRPFRRYFRETGWRHLIGILVGIFAIFPLLYVISASFNPNGTLLTANGLFQRLSLDSYVSLFTSAQHPYGAWFVNTLVIGLVIGLSFLRCCFFLTSHVFGN